VCGEREREREEGRGDGKDLAWMRSKQSGKQQHHLFCGVLLRELAAQSRVGRLLLAGAHSATASPALAAAGTASFTGVAPLVAAAPWRKPLSSSARTRTYRSSQPKSCERRRRRRTRRGTDRETADAR